MELIPDKRNYILEFAAVTDAECHATLEGEAIPCRKSYDEDSSTLRVEIDRAVGNQTLVVGFETRLELSENPVEKLAFEFLNQAEIAFMTKEVLFQRFGRGRV